MTSISNLFLTEVERRASVRMQSPRAKKEAAVVGAGAGIRRNRKLDL